jgi:hypothetical protein
MGIYLRGKSWYYTFVHKRVRYAGSIGPVSRTLAKEEFARKKAAAVENRLNPARAKKSPLFNDFAESGNSPSGLCQEQGKTIDSDESQTPRTPGGTKNYAS